MKKIFLVLLITLGFHGIKHSNNTQWINLKKYKTHKKVRENRLLDYMHNNGIGV